MNGIVSIDIDTRIYVDTNVLIEAFERLGQVNARLVEFLAKVEEENIPRLVTSELTLAESLVKPIAQSLHDLIGVYDNWTVSNSFLEVVPVNRAILGDAALFRARDKSLKLPDAIHLTTAIRAQCRYFLTNDTRIKSQYGVEILSLTEDNIKALIESLSYGRR